MIANSQISNPPSQAPPGWQIVRLGDVCDINPRRPADLNRSDDAPTTFVPMASVDDRRGVIAAPLVRPYAEVRKGYTCFAEGDVLFAKITPCMQNGKHAIAQNLIDRIGFASTEFHVIRPGPQITAEWVHYFIRRPSVLDDATHYFTGTVGQQRVPDDFLKNLRLPLPPLPEQRRIAARLREQIEAVERARKAAEEQLEAACTLPGAYLHSVFDSPVANRWGKRRLGDIALIEMGQSPAGESYNAEGQGSPLLNGPTEFGPQHPIPVQWTTAPTRFAKPGDILFCVRGATTGRKTIADQEYCIGRGLAAIRARPGLTTTPYLWHLLDAIRDRLIQHAAGSTFINLPGSQLTVFLVPSPPLNEQTRIASFLDAQHRAALQARASLAVRSDAIQKLSPALLREAFSGRL